MWKQIFGTFSVALLAIILIEGSAERAHAITKAERNKMQSTIADLMRERQGIDAEQVELNKKIDDAKWVEKNLTKTDGELRSEKTKLDNVKNQISIEAGGYESSLSSYNQSCLGHTFQLPDEQAAYSQCQSRKSYLDSTRDSIQQRSDKYSRDADSYNKRLGLFQENINLWIENNEKYESRQAEIDDKTRNWLIRYNVLVNSAAFRQLVSKEARSKECGSIQGIENLDLYNLDGAAERAHRCLQNVWDGAK